MIVSSIPVGAGLSSSAAIEVASYTLLEELLSSPSTRYIIIVSDVLNNEIIMVLYLFFLKYSLKEKALACQKAEHVFAGCPCGIMDQFVCTFATSGCAYLLNCK